MNNPNNMLIIESRSNYAFQLRGKNLSFSEIRNTSTAFFTSLPEGVRNELYNNMCHGTIKLDCEPELNAYMYAFGAMHNAKLKDAFSHLSTNFFNEREIDIIDYGCGQAMGCISYADYLRENNHTQNVRRITLIEPSYIALARAALHSSLLFPNAEIVTINKGFDDLTASDIEVDTNIPTLHIFSNVLDIGSTPNYNGVFNLGTFSNLVLEISKGYNEYVITEPLFSDFHRDEQADIFTSSLGINVYYERKCSAGEFVTNKTWTCVIKCGCVGLPDVKVSSLQKDSWTWHEFRKLYGKPKLGTFVKSTGETFKSVVFIDESNEANMVYVRFSKLHGELSSKVIIQNKDKIRIYQKIDYNGKKYYELELSDFSTFIDVNNIIPNNEIWYITFNDKVLDDCQVDCFNVPIISNIYENGKGVIRFEGDVTEIRFGAFFLCSSLISITIPNSVIIIEDYAFYGCSKLKEFKGNFAADNGCCLINKGRLISFANNCGIEEYVIPNNVTEIGNDAFAHCYNLKRIIIPNSVTKIGGEAFSGCQNLASITLSQSITEIEDATFATCRCLTHLIIPNGVTKIGDSAFVGCSSLKELTIPNTVTKMGNGVFSGCTSIVNVNMPNEITEIGDSVFKDCSSLSEINIPKDVITIGKETFSGCSSLSMITIPRRVKTIGRDIFYRCTNLKNVYCRAAILPQHHKDTFVFFEHIGYTIYVPRELVNVYKNADDWELYADKIVGYDFE